MSETPKNPQPDNTPPRPPRPVGNPNAPRRVTARRLDEEQRQRIVILITAAAIGLAVLSLIIGALYERVWLPSRPVAEVGTVSLARSDYWLERRNAFARQIVQNFQLLAFFGGNSQFTQQLQGQSPAIDAQVRAIRGAPVDDAVVEAWITRQIKEQGAVGRNISATDEEVDQALVGDLGVIFLPPPTPAETTTPAPTEDAAATATAAAAPSPTAGGPTATAAPSATPEPTFTPQPTPAGAEATTQRDQIIDEIYRRFELEVVAVGATPTLTRDDFRTALLDQYREQAITNKLQEALVPREGFSFSTEPERVTARQVLIAVTPPAGATQEQIDAAFAAALPRAQAVASELRASGADFAAIAAQRSDDPGSRTEGGNIGAFDQTGVADNGATYPPELVSAAFGLQQDTISDPIRSQFGWHVIEVTNRDVPSEEAQLRTARTAALDTWVADQRAQLNVERFPAVTATPTAEPTAATPSVVPTFLPGPPTAVPTEVPTAEPTGAATAAPTTAAPTTAAPAATSTVVPTIPATTVPAGTAAPAAPATPAATGTAAPTP